jgi:hypothetical protein
MEQKMASDTNSFNLFGVNVETDSDTGIKIDSGEVGVEVSPDGSTSVDISGSEIVGVDLTNGTTVDISNSTVVDVNSSNDVTVDVADELISVDTTGETASVEVEGETVELDLSEGVLFGVGEDLLFADLNEGVAINTDLLTEAGIEIPDTLEI